MTDIEGSAGKRCDSCAGEVLWDPIAQVNRCPYCGNTQAAELPAIGGGGEAVPEQDLQQALARKTEAEGGIFATERRVHCQQCNAVTVWRAEKRSGRCAFCGSPKLVTESDGGERIPPGGVLPFALSKQQAGLRIEDWIRGRWFAPNALHRASSLGLLNGVYIPYWTFDARAAGSYTGQRGDYVNSPARVPGSNRAQQGSREVRWRPASGNVARNFDDVLVCAGESLPSEYLYRAGDWNTKELVPYEDRYLQGFIAEDYSIELQQAWSLAQRAMEDALRADAERQMGGDVHRNVQVNARFTEPSFKHCLLPAWLGTYVFAGKRYVVVVNGTTGKVAGRAPTSMVKVGLAVGAFALVLLLLFWLGTSL